MLGMSAWAAPRAGAHSLGPKFFSQQLDVKLDPEWLRIVYTVEVPTSVLQREFIDTARDKPDAAPAELREEFKRSKVDALRTGLDVSLNRQHLTLEDDPDTGRESRPNDMYFQLYRYTLRARVSGKLADQNTLAIRNRNYEGEETLYSEHVELTTGLGEFHTGLEDDQRFFLDSRTGIKWYPSPDHRNLSIAFTGAGVKLGGTAAAGAAPGAAIPTMGGTKDEKGKARTTAEVGRMESYLGAEKLSFTLIVVGLAVAFFLGCGHALSPGHGKTVVAAYLVGSKGRIRDAVFLGTVVTATHTSVVILLGIVTLSLSQFILPETLYPYLAFTSGALIVGLGIWMLLIRLRALFGPGGFDPHDHSHDHGAHDHDHDHPHDHDHSHDHDHGDHDHDHGHAHAHDPAMGHDHADDHSHADHDHDHGHPPGYHDHGDGHGHAHFPDPSQPVTLRSLLSLGISGGMVPCPSALVVLLAAVAYHRVAFGLALVMSFSLGLALVLIAIGIAMVLAGKFMQTRFGVRDSRWVRRLPVLSAVIVILFGLGICGKVLLDEGIVSIHV